MIFSNQPVTPEIMINKAENINAVVNCERLAVVALVASSAAPDVDHAVSIGAL